MTVQNVSEALSSVQIMYGAPFQQSVVRNAAIMKPPTQQNLFDPPPDRSQVVADSHLSSASVVHGIAHNGFGSSV
jgi:hypothetical protein